MTMCSVFDPKKIKLSSFAIWIDFKGLVYIKANCKLKLFQLSILFIYNYTKTLKEKNLKKTILNMHHLIYP